MIKAYINQFDTLWNRTKSKLEKIEPFITSMFEGDICEWVDKIPDKRKYFMFGTNDYLADFKEYLVGMCQTTNRGVPLYIYAKSDKSMIVSPRQKIKSLIMPRLGENEDIGNTIKIFELKQEKFQALRSQYMNIHINPGQATAHLVSLLIIS